MGITLPNGDILIIPEPPQTMRTDQPELYQYLNKLRVSIQDFARGQFNNTFTVATAINVGTSGVFLIASGGHLTVSSGIVVAVATT